MVGVLSDPVPSKMYIGYQDPRRKGSKAMVQLLVCSAGRGMERSMAPETSCTRYRSRGIGAETSPTIGIKVLCPR